jgi:hypothetical protein
MAGVTRLGVHFVAIFFFFFLKKEAARGIQKYFSNRYYMRQERIRKF